MCHSTSPHSFHPVHTHTHTHTHDNPTYLTHFSILLSGMFWRNDPTGRTALAAQIDWPRDGAIIRGRPVKVHGEMWLRAHKVRQLHQQDETWTKAPKNAFLPFEYNDHYFLEPVGDDSKSNGTASTNGGSGAETRPTTVVGTR